MMQLIDSTSCLSSPTALGKAKSSLQMVRDLYDGASPMMDEEELELCQWQSFLRETSYKSRHDILWLENYIEPSTLVLRSV